MNRCSPTPRCTPASSKQKTTLQLYTERLVKDGLIPEGEIEDMKAAFQARLNEEFEAGKDYKPNKADWLDGRWKNLGTQGSGKLPARRNRDQARNDGRGRHRPDPRARRVRPAQDRRPPARGQGARCSQTGKGFDWATAEALAFGSLVTEGFPVRLVRSGLHPRHLQPAPLGLHRPEHRGTLLSR